jgi:hypothetical protein
MRWTWKSGAAEALLQLKPHHSGKASVLALRTVLPVTAAKQRWQHCAILVANYQNSLLIKQQYTIGNCI